MPSLTENQAAEWFDLGLELHQFVQAEPGEEPETLADWRQRSHSIWLAVRTFGPSA